ncbi:hypothetical protein F383_27405 [Gossypium arboreum]|uniref:Uncharacterized protein n=1 Tax=Gossypium arboreum TaxID=29729 RepID=A0A0B0PBP1_GOSAR|nr:hypothetical protein F383_21933 [Gossypium arboreum]KHG22290.1 hypothetical protein F383_27405 [Gossypium arboreum]
MRYDDKLVVRMYMRKLCLWDLMTFMKLCLMLIV